MLLLLSFVVIVAVAVIIVAVAAAVVLCIYSFLSIRSSDNSDIFHSFIPKSWTQIFQNFSLSCILRFQPGFELVTLKQRSAGWPTKPPTLLKPTFSMAVRFEWFDSGKADDIWRSEVQLQQKFWWTAITLKTLATTVLQSSVCERLTARLKSWLKPEEQLINNGSVIGHCQTQSVKKDQT